MSHKDLDELIPMTDDFWKVAEKVIGDDTALQLMHAQIVARLKEDFTDADTLQLMQLERIAAMYVAIRSKEKRGTFAHDRAYKETTQLWHQMVGDARKTKGKEDTVRVATEDAISAVSAAVVKALTNLDLPDYQKAEILESVSVALEG